MGTRRRLTKRHLKQDKFVTTTFEFTAYVRSHLRQIVGGAVAGAVLATAAIVYLRHRGGMETQALTAMGKARLSYQSGNYALATADLKSVVDQYGGSGVGREAGLLLADSQYLSGDYKGALATLDGLGKGLRGDHALGYSAALVRAHAHEALGERDQVPAAYREAVRLAQFDYQRLDALMEAGRALRAAGKAEEAIQAYDEAIALGVKMKSNRADEARMWRGELEAQRAAAVGSSQRKG